MRKVLTNFIAGYQYLISPFFGPSCRFTPTCSDYAIESIEQHGILKGCWLALRRIGRCHPWHEGGHDPVPPVPGTGKQPQVIKTRCHHG